MIVGLTFPNQPVGHAVVATGQVFRLTPTGVFPSNPTRAEYLEALYANDDQIGPNIRVGLRQGSALNEAHYTIEENASYLIIPLPGKVYLPAEKAEALSWSNLRSYAADWPAFQAKHQARLGGGSIPLGDDFVAKLAANEVIARTYLTYGWKYKRRGLRNRLSNPVRQVILNLEAPRFVYVTEFATVGDTTGRTQFDRRIQAHSVVDATAKNQGADSVLFLNAPGFCAWYSHDKDGVFQRSVAPIADSTTYYPKARGDVDFAKFKLSQF